MKRHFVKKWRFMGKLKIVIACESAFLREG